MAVFKWFIYFFYFVAFLISVLHCDNGTDFNLLKDHHQVVKEASLVVMAANEIVTRRLPPQQQHDVKGQTTTSTTAPPTKAPTPISFKVTVPTTPSVTTTQAGGYTPTPIHLTSSTVSDIPSDNREGGSVSGGSAGSGGGADYCPAVKAWGSNTYIAYNPIYQAATLEEAVTFFVDLTADDPSEAKTMTGAKLTSKELKDWTRKAEKPEVLCKTRECLGCVETLSERLKNQLSDSKIYDPAYRNVSNSNALALNSFWGLSRAKPSNLSKLCKRLHTHREANNRNKALKMSTVSADEINRLMKLAKPRSANVGIRQKRDASTRPGTSSPLECTYKKGDPLTDGSNMVGLCTLCWSIRTLPNKYFPRFLNELSCDASDSGCMANWGTCVERTRSIDLLYNYGTEDNPKWTQYSISTSVACECRVQMGSALHNIAVNR